MNLWTRLLRWYDKHGRDLPWRKTRDPYRILVSEIMLQQTQVTRVLLFYARWLKRFPDWKSLSVASNADVIRAWAGLGYNRRALMLRNIARQVTERSQSKIDWLQLKGIGPYTAAAMAVFAFRERTLPIDTNIRRVLGRLLFALPYPQPVVDDRIRAQIDRILPHRGRFYDVPQALFDLATMHCTKIPTCATCPMKSVCPAAEKFLSGRVRVPKQMIKKSIESRHRDKKFPDRIYRGRILKLVRTNGSIKMATIGTTIDESYNKKQDHEWILKMVSRMEKDGLIRTSGPYVQLPE